VLQVDKIAV